MAIVTGRRRAKRVGFTVVTFLTTILNRRGAASRRESRWQLVARRLAPDRPRQVRSGLGRCSSSTSTGNRTGAPSVRPRLIRRRDIVARIDPAHDLRYSYRRRCQRVTVPASRHRWRRRRPPLGLLGESRRRWDQRGVAEEATVTCRVTNMPAFNLAAGISRIDDTLNVWVFESPEGQSPSPTRRTACPGTRYWSG